MRPTECASGAIRQNILPPTLNTATPSHCTMRVAAGRLVQNLSICLGVTPAPYTPRTAHAMVRHDRMAPRQAGPTPAVPAGARTDPRGDARLVCRAGLRRSRDAYPAGGTGRRGPSRGLR